MTPASIPHKLTRGRIDRIHALGVLSSSADHNRNDYFFLRAQPYGTRLDVKSAPPFKPSRIRNLIGAIITRIAA